jgi:hypothetical protein
MRTDGASLPAHDCGSALACNAMQCQCQCQCHASASASASAMPCAVPATASARPRRSEGTRKGTRRVLPTDLGGIPFHCIACMACSACPTTGRMLLGAPHLRWDSPGRPLIDYVVLFTRLLWLDGPASPGALPWSALPCTAVERCHSAAPPTGTSTPRRRRPIPSRDSRTSCASDSPGNRLEFPLRSP